MKLNTLFLNASTLEFQPHSKLLFGSACVLALASCAAPANRADNPDLFKEVAIGHVTPENVPYFIDCLIDGFTRSKPQGTNDRVVQQQRSFGSRLDVYVGPHLMLSADVERSGKTRLLEGHAALFVSQKKEVAEYEACVGRYRQRP